MDIIKLGKSYLEKFELRNQLDPCYCKESIAMVYQVFSLTLSVHNASHSQANDQQQIHRPARKAIAKKPLMISEAKNSESPGGLNTII